MIRKLRGEVRGQRERFVLPPWWDGPDKAGGQTGCLFGWRGLTPCTRPSEHSEAHTLWEDRADRIHIQPDKRDGLKMSRPVSEG